MAKRQACKKIWFSTETKRMSTTAKFPDYSQLQTKAKFADLERLAEADLTRNEYVCGSGMARLLSAAFQAYASSLSSKLWTTDPFLKKAKDNGRQFQLFLAAMFDLSCNIEYVHSRLVNSKWIYCHREGQSKPTVYYSFLKQCPLCCLDVGLEKRLSGAQHKPSSHHIGEITTTAMALLLKLVMSCGSKPMSVAVITKQSHDVDVVAYREDLFLLLEVKASPMVTFPVGMDLSEALFTTSGDERKEYRQHSLVDVTISHEELFLFLPHRKERFPLPRGTDQNWPYQAATRCFGQPANLLTYFSAWLELFGAYSVHKTQRNDRDEVLAYLVNGWGDEIDSNKTKPGLGRTDDIKKGTYQLLKFGNYYADDAAELPVRGALATNLDPLFLKADYFNKLADVRWGKGKSFVKDGKDWRIADRNLHYLYNAVFAFNEPVINDSKLVGSFDIGEAERALQSGRLDKILKEWAAVT
jgi:hypothetical protein